MERPGVRTRGSRAGRRLAALAAAGCGSAGAAALVLTGHRLLAGVAASVAVFGLIAGTPGSADRTDRRALFLAPVMDRVFDGCVLAAVAWMARHGSVRVSVLALVALGTSSLAGYELAKGQSLRYAGAAGPGYRGLRLSLIALGLLTGWLEASLWAVVVLTGAASIARAANVARQGGGPAERRASSA